MNYEVDYSKLFEEYGIDQYDRRTVIKTYQRGENIEDIICDLTEIFDEFGYSMVTFGEGKISCVYEVEKTLEEMIEELVYKMHRKLTSHGQ